MERAKHISCAHSAMEMNIPFYVLSRYPCDCAQYVGNHLVRSQSYDKNGVCLGKEECIPVKEAIYAVTKYAAYQYFEEDRKGTIKEGKLADLVVLSENPAKQTLWQSKIFKCCIPLKKAAAFLMHIMTNKLQNKKRCSNLSIAFVNSESAE